MVVRSWSGGDRDRHRQTSTNDIVDRTVCTSTYCMYSTVCTSYAGCTNTNPMATLSNTVNFSRLLLLVVAAVVVVVVPSPTATTT